MSKKPITALITVWGRSEPVEMIEKSHFDQMEAKLKDWQASQQYRYIGRDGKPVLARDLEARLEKLEADLKVAAKADPMTATEILLRRDIGQLELELAAEKALADRLQDDLFGIEVYAGDTISGPSEGVPDLKWMMDGVEVLHDRAVAGRAAYRKARGL